MKILYVDDLRQPIKWQDKNHKISIARTYKNAIDFLKEDIFDIIDLDNDLGEQKEGYDILKYIIENEIKVDTISVHTMNSVARGNMLQLLARYFNGNVILY